MLGVVDVGGGFRDSYGAGIFDYCLDQGIRFDYCIGVSAGSANIVSYLSGQKGRSYRFYNDYVFRRRYVSLRNYILRRSYINLDYGYRTLSAAGGEDPLDFEALMRNPAVMKVVACNAQTGGTVYFDKSDMTQDHYEILMGSSCIPVLCRPYPVRGVLCFDGGIADPVPVARAFEDGCDKVVLILTKPESVIRSPEKDAGMARRLEKKYPHAAEALAARADTYNRGVRLAKEYRDQGRVLILSPKDTAGMATLTKDKKSIRKMYDEGVQDAAAIAEFLSRES